MDIRQLKYFNTIVEEGTVTAAAKKLHMTQPPLTAQIKLLEKELGCELFYRNGRHLLLSDAGTSLYAKSKNILNLCAIAKSELSEYSHGTLGTLRLGIVSSVQGSFFLSLISDFQKKHTNVKYDIYNSNTYLLLDNIRSGLIDLAIVRTPFSATDLEIVTLKKESLVAVGFPHFFEDSSNDDLPFSKLASMPLIIYRRWENVLKKSFETMGFSPAIKCCNDNAQMTIGLACVGMGVGIVPASATTELDDTNLVIKNISDFNLSSEIAMVCKNKNQLTNTARLFWDMVNEEIL